MSNLKYKRVLLKISGEGFGGSDGSGLASEGLSVMADQIVELWQMQVQTAVVVGAGNLVRGASLSKKIALQRVTADQMGMLATVINALALQDVLEKKGAPTRVLSAIDMTTICEPFIRRRAVSHLERNRIIILAGGTGNPYFTTDTCAALRASEIQADVLIKATKVDGVYSADPVQDPSAKKYEKLEYLELITNDLRVMDHTAVSMCRENNIDIIVCNMMKSGNVTRVVQGEQIGTLISS